MFRVLALIITTIGIRLWLAPLNRISLPKFNLDSLMRNKAKPKFQGIEMISLLAAVRQEIVAGIPVQQSVANAIVTQPAHHFRNTAKALSEDSDLLAALKIDADQIANPALLRLIKILSINKSSGASISKALDMLIKAELSRQEQAHQIAAELSGVKATITVLALLPIVGMFLGLIMGVNVPYWLLTNPVGWLCVILAALLEILGLFWVRRLIRTVK